MPWFYLLGAGQIPVKQARFQTACGGKLVFRGSLDGAHSQRPQSLGKIICIDQVCGGPLHQLNCLYILDSAAVLDMLPDSSNRSEFGVGIIKLALGTDLEKLWQGDIRSASSSWKHHLLKLNL